MPTADEAAQFHRSAEEMKRRARERARRKKMNPDGTLKDPFDEKDTNDAAGK